MNLLLRVELFLFKLLMACAFVTFLASMGLYLSGVLPVGAVPYAFAALISGAAMKLILYLPMDPEAFPDTA